jgi:hypothetical protein
VSVVDRGEPVASCSEWHGDGTAGEDDRASHLAALAVAQAMGEARPRRRQPRGKPPPAARQFVVGLGIALGQICLPATLRAAPLGEADEEVQQQPAQQQRPKAGQKCTVVEPACVLVAGKEAGCEG